MAVLGTSVAVSVEVGWVVAVLVGSGVDEAVSVGDAVKVAVGDAVKVAVGEDVSVGVSVTVGVDVSVGVNVTVGVDVSVGVAVAVGVLVTVGVDVSVGVLVTVDVGVSVGVLVTVGVAVGVGVGSRMVRLSDRVALTVRAPPAALVNERFVKSIVVCPAVRPKSERDRIWTLPVAPEGLTEVSVTDFDPSPPVHAPVTFAVKTLHESNRTLVAS